MSVVVVLSAYREPPGELAKREAVAARLSGRVLRPVGDHTYAEAKLALLAAGDERDVQVVTSGYHGERALLTFIAVLREWHREQDVLVRVIQTEDCVTPERERDKIRDYQLKGHCATYEDADSYVAHWMLKRLCPTT
jgi:hypothetical protein